MTDALITDLAQIRGLRVISRTSVMQYKKVRKRLPEIARELNVDAVVEGTVTRSGSRVRVTAQLIHAPTDQHLWARSYERDLVDILRLQGELAQAIAEAVRVKLAPQVRAHLQSAPKLNAEAYEAFYRGLVAATQQNPEGYKKAIGEFERAVAKQPDFAQAHAAISRCYYQFAFSGSIPPVEFMPEAELAARHALQADDSLAEAHVSLGKILYRYYWDWPASETEFRRALELSPNDAAGHYSYGAFLSARGRSDEASAETELARKLDPKGAGDLGEPTGALRYDERTLATHRKAIERNPTPRGYFQLGSALVINGDLREGIKALESAVAHPPGNSRFLAYLGYAYGAAGRAKEARVILRELIARSGDRYVSSFGIAMVHAGLRENKAALDRLEKAYQEHAFELAHLNVTAAFDSLRSDPRFRDLVKRVGLPATSFPR
ncbi:MAG: tetratricopeptide repeat protein [Thermoanaerobaculia bacterium]